MQETKTKLTVLEETVRMVKKGVAPLWDENTPRAEWQRLLDKITLSVMQKVTAQDLVDHTNTVYNNTAEAYTKEPYNQFVIDELIMFMNMLPDGARVLDVGCGPGRDSFFMTTIYYDGYCRYNEMQRMKDGMTTVQKFIIPTKKFDVVGIDNSLNMITLARNKNRSLINPSFIQMDMHYLSENFGTFDGIWSCTALFTHTPFSILNQTMKGISMALKTGGIFFTSYTCENRQNYDKLQISSTGRIKYFSQPNPELISEIARKYGMTLKAQLFSDLVKNGKVEKENLFVSQFFKKK